MPTAPGFPAGLTFGEGIFVYPCLTQYFLILVAICDIIFSVQEFISLLPRQRGESSALADGRARGRPMYSRMNRSTAVSQLAMEVDGNARAAQSSERT